MGKYRVLIKPSAVKEIERISHKADRQRVVERIAALGEEPRPPHSQKLTWYDRDRLRQGPHRIIYSVEDDAQIVTVVKSWTP